MNSAKEASRQALCLGYNDQGCVLRVHQVGPKTEESEVEAYIRLLERCQEAIKKQKQKA